MKNRPSLSSKHARRLYKQLQLSLLIALMLFHSFIGAAVAASPPQPPSLVTGGQEVVVVSSFVSGATLKLYLAGGSLIDTAESVTSQSYTFTNVEPGASYYVTQTVDGEESLGSSVTNVFTRIPLATAGGRYVEISNVHLYPGTTLSLYTFSGYRLSDSPTNQGNGVYRFSGLLVGEKYYVIRNIKGVTHGVSNTVTVTDYVAPQVTSGIESIVVSGFEAGATLKLYLRNGTWKATEANVTDATYTFTNVEPSANEYYVTQTVNGVETTNSAFTNASPRTPVATAGIGYVEIANVHPNADVKLYTVSGVPVLSLPVDQGASTVRFEGLTAGSSYYANQSVNGVISDATSIVTVQSQVYAAPTVTSGLESITVSSFESGATLKLYLNGSGLQKSALSVTGSTYTFNDVVPNHSEYYVTQTVGGVESQGSLFTNASLRTPVATAGIGYVEIANVYPNADVTLYTVSGVPVLSLPVDQGASTVRFEGLTAGSSYYANQSVNGVISDATSIVTVQPQVYAAPTATSGLESIMVSGFESGATLKLYLRNGTLQSTEVNVTDAPFTFTPVEPNVIGYYVTQTVGGEESVNSHFTNANLRTPHATAGIGYVDITNVYPNATLSLYTFSGEHVSDSPIDQNNGTFRFTGLPARNAYYATQRINGVTSDATSIVTVQPQLYGAPIATGGLESITVSGFESGATLKLYLANGILQETAANVMGASHTFTHVEPNIIGYYVTQTVDGEESTNSSFTNAILRTPVASAGLTYVDVSNVYPGATVTLYTIDGSPMLSTPVAQENGILRFRTLTPGREYYAVQSINGVRSDGSSIVWVPAVASAPTHVTVVAGNGQAVVSFNAPVNDGGNTITSYEVTALPGNITASGTTSPITVTGLSNGTSYTFTVKAINAVGGSASSEASNAVTPYSSSSSNYTEMMALTNDVLLLNGKSVDVGQVVTRKQQGQLVTTVTLDSQKLQNQLLQQGTKMASITVNRSTDTIVIEGDGELFERLINQGVTLDIRTPHATYTLPAAQINIDALAAQLGSPPSFNQIKITIKIATPSADQIRAAELAAAKQGVTMIVPPVAFIVQATYGEQTVDVTTFSTYVERTLTLPEGVDTSNITTGIVIEPNGTIRHVPTIIFEEDGKVHAKINSLTNSLYSVIWNPVTFKDVQNHWGQDAVNDMGSRLVIEGTGNGLFNPQRDITRAEFAAILVRGLGLEPQSGASVFSDVQSSAWYSGAVNIAYTYGLIDGFEDGTFRPNDQITREQAMLIIAKAMKLTNLDSQLPVQSTEQTLQAFKDADRASVWALDGIASSVQAGIISGRSSSELMPKAFITRAEVAAIVQRLLQSSKLI